VIVLQAKKKRKKKKGLGVCSSGRALAEQVGGPELNSHYQGKRPKLFRKSVRVHKLAQLVCG
jgi:hypothetical protein